LVWFTQFPLYVSEFQESPNNATARTHDKTHQSEKTHVAPLHGYKGNKFLGQSPTSWYTAVERQAEKHNVRIVFL